METGVRHRVRNAWVGGLAIAMVLAAAFMLREPLLHMFKPVERVVKEETFDQTSERHIKVQVFQSTAFMLQYGQAYVVKYPNMTIEPTETIGLSAPDGDVYKAYADKMTNEQLDIVYLPTAVYKKMASEGLLYPLDAFIQKEKYNLNTFIPGVIDYLRERDTGQLFGLSPTFNSQAIYYNKDLFNKYGVPFPTDRMTWEQLFELAARFPTDGRGDNRVYGFSPPTSGASIMLNMIGSTNRLSMTDAEGKKLLLNSPAYRKSISLVAEGIRKGWLQQSARGTGSITGIDMYKRNAFLTGNAAMALSNSGLARDLAEGKRRYNLSTFEWDMVTEPVSGEQPNLSTSFSLDGVYAINAKANNPRDAWELLKVIHSKTIAQKNVASMLVMQPSTIDGVPILPKEARREAFSALQIGTEATADTAAPYSFSAEINAIVNQEIQTYAQGAQSLEQTLQTLQDKGQQALDKANLLQQK